MRTSICNDCGQRVFWGLDAGVETPFDLATVAYRFNSCEGGSPIAIRVHGVYTLHWSHCRGESFTGDAIAKSKGGRPRKKRHSPVSERVLERRAWRRSGIKPPYPDHAKNN
jgi:hypothetical protein